MPKKILVHYPTNVSETGQIGSAIRKFYDQLLTSLAEITTNFEIIPSMDPELRRSVDFNHITYHTHKKGENNLNVKMGYLKEYFYLDDTGYSGWSSIRKTKLPKDIDPDAAEAFWEGLNQRYIMTGATKYDGLPHERASELPESYIAIFLQVANDAVLKFANFDTEAMVNGVIAAAEGQPVVIKRHPACNSFQTHGILHYAKARNSNVTEATHPVHEVIANATKVVCVNSGTGFEALMQLKPVFNCGQSDYGHVSRLVKQPEDFAEAFAERPASPEQIKKFLYWYLSMNMFNADDPGFTARLQKRFDERGWI